MKNLFLGLVLLAAGFTVTNAEDFNGTVTKVHDGDTAHVKKADGTVVKVRFLYVDTPEIDQPHGTEARDFVADLILGEQVTVKSNEVDQHGRALGEILIGNTNVNKKLIEEGHGWWFYHYHQDTQLGHLEAAAKAAMKGLWAARAPLYPRAWRDGARPTGSSGGSSSGSNGGNGTGTTSTNPPVFIMALLPNPTGQDAGNETAILANRTTADVDLTGWKLKDDDGGSHDLTGTIPAGSTVTIKLTESLQLGNGGDVVSLQNAADNEVHELSYDSAPSGQFVVVNQ